MTVESTNSHVRGTVAVKPTNGAELRDDIERLRAQLGDTIEELAHRMDVRARAKAKISTVGGDLRDRGQRFSDLAHREPGVTAAFAIGLVVLVALVRRMARS